MPTAFFALAARSPSRQAGFRRLVVAHLMIVAAGCVGLRFHGHWGSPEPFAQLLLVAGIVEGAVLVGWRLTQLPKSQALEFLLVTPLRPRRVFLAEALVGLAQLALAGLSALPLLALVVVDGFLNPLDLWPILCVPFTWGAVGGLGLTMWAYEPTWLRRIGEKAAIALIVMYLVVGVLAGEHLRIWLSVLPDELAQVLLSAFFRFHTDNPFGVMQAWCNSRPRTGVGAVWQVTAVGLGLALLLLWRGACRLQPHFHEFHYRPRTRREEACQPAVGDWPLTWWAVKRVAHFSGRVNLWLAGGFGVLYGLYVVAGDAWPAWLGKNVFVMCDQAGGVAALTTGLVLLAAVPAAFQYGLWDSSVTDRRRRLELLLLTELGPADYWHAAATAAWSRGRGYLAIAAMLWIAGVVGGRLTVAQALAAAASGVLLWSAYFAIGFRAFSRGLHTNGLGMLLTVGLPVLVFGAHRLGWSAVGALLPPGLVHSAAAGSIGLAAIVGAAVAAWLTVATARRALRHGDAELRQWYGRHAGAA
jgi:hypothetical protein